MALVNKVQKRVIMPKDAVIKFQILTHCYINKITVSDSDLDCLTLLSKIGPIELTDFCYDASEEYKIFKSSQTVRNCINKCEKSSLVNKDPNNKKIISINPNVQVQVEGKVLLEYNFLGT